jgi:hypothetical protein
MGRKKSQSMATPITSACSRSTLNVLQQIQTPLSAPGVPPAVLTEIEMMNDRWIIQGWWLLYEMIPNVDIARHPFNTKAFQAHRSYAKVLYRFLEIAKFCFEESSALKKHYSSPLDWWLKCIQEAKQMQFDSILSGKTITEKAQYIAGLKDFGRFLEGASEDQDLSDFGENWKLLLNASGRIAFGLHPNSPKRKRFEDTCWRPLIADWKSYVAKTSTNEHLQPTSVQQDNLVTPSRGRPKKLPILPQAKNRRERSDIFVKT